MIIHGSGIGPTEKTFLTGLQKSEAVEAPRSQQFWLEHSLHFSEVEILITSLKPPEEEEKLQ